MSKAKADPRGWPDYTYPMTIIGQELNVAIDIAAQSLPTLDINIAASDVTLDVNIAASTVTLNVNIESISEGVTFNVAQSGTWTINAVQSGTWTINIGAPLDAEGNVETSIVKSVQLDVNIASSAVTLNINVESISEGVVFNVAQSGAWTVNAAQTGTWTINIGAPLDASGYLETHIMDSVQLDINIAASAVTLNVNIESISSGVVFNVAQSGTWTINAVQSGDWSINIESVSAGVTFNVNITGSTATLDVNITGSTATLDVNIASSSVAINIKTETGANIVIDKLVESAYTEERRVISNHGATPSIGTGAHSTLRGKFFPRGCRGFIRQVEIYCDNPDTSSHQYTVRLSPSPGVGPVITATLTVPAGSSLAWRSVSINKAWNYDSLFVWIQADSDSYPRHRFDDGEPYDYYSSSDGLSWTAGDYRLWIQVETAGQTVGDLPVSGTVNSVAVPSVSSSSTKGQVAVPAHTESTLAEVRGAGKVYRISLWTQESTLEFRFYVDGVQLPAQGLIINRTFTPDHVSDLGYSASTPMIQYVEYSTGNYRIDMQIPFSFRQSFKITAYNPATEERAATAIIQYELTV